MRSYQVFAAMPPERAVSLFRGIHEKMPELFAQASATACVALKVRPVYLRRQPFEKRAESVRKALARVASNAAADELLASYFLECRKELLVEWLDTLGVPHEDGTLSEDQPAAPARDALEKAIASFRGDGEDADRSLLLFAFAAQEAIDWPEFEALLPQRP